MKGYKLPNGNYITGKELERQQRLFRKRLKEEKRLKEAGLLPVYKTEKELEQEERLNNMLDRYIDGIKQQNKQEEINGIKNEILVSLHNNNPFTYREYLILWDLITTNYYQIESDMERGKITKQDLWKIIDYIEEFSLEIIPDYWKEKLTA